MKRIVSLATLVMVIAMGSVNAQTTPAKAPKYGHADIEQVVMNLPDIKKADSLLQQFRKDSLENQLPYFISEYQRKDSIAKSPATPPAIKQTVEQEAANYLQIIQNWEPYSQQLFNRKSQEIYGPYFNRAYELINTVAKENGYTWVFKQDSLLVAPETDDLLPLIAKKLGIKLQTAPAPAGGNR